MVGRVLYITVLFILGSYAQRENFVIEGNDNIVTSEVQFNEFNFGSNWRGPAQSIVCINYRYDEAATNEFGEPDQSFRYFPPGSLAGASITDSGDGQSILRLSGVNAAHVGEYIAVATNEHGEDRASAFVTQGVAPFITEGSVKSEVGQAPRIPDGFTIVRIDSGQSRTIDVGGQVNIEEGGSVTLSADDIEGQPGRNFIWTYRNDPTEPFGPLPSSTRINQGVSGTTGLLTINNTDRTIYGDYRVVASNRFGESVPVTTIVGAPPIIRFSSGSVTSGQGEIGNDFTFRLTID